MRNARLSRLGRDVTEQEAIRLEPLLADASAQIRRYCRRDFQQHTNETQVLNGYDSEIWLPGRPVLSVSAVALDGGGSLPDLPVVWFSFDGIATVRLGSAAGVINLPEAWGEAGSYPGTYKVTYSWGYPDGPPDDVVMVCANAALSVLTAPTAAAGVVGESIGPYSYRLERSGGGVAVALSAADLMLLKDYRGGVQTLQARLR